MVGVQSDCRSCVQAVGYEDVNANIVLLVRHVLARV